MDGGEEATLRVLIADDDESTRVLLADILDDEPSVELVGSAKDAQEAIDLAEELEPDVVLLDWLMPNGGGSKAASEIHQRLPTSRIVALTGFDPLQASHDMMSAGAVGFLQKGCSAEELVAGIRSACRW